MSVTRTVLVTGAGGALGQLLSAELPAAGWRVRGLDIAEPRVRDEEFVLGSVENLELVLQACADVDAIVHLGGIANPGFEWTTYLDVNIGGTWNVLEAARRAGVPRVVIASSNHAAGYAERGTGEIDAGTPARPDSLYGVSKAAMEALAVFYADEYGLETTSVRIGSCLPRPTSLRSLSSWLSYGDFTRLMLAAIGGVWHGPSTVWGVSNNTRRWWSLSEGERIGYHPQDDAEVFAADVRATGDDPPFVGGSRPPFSITNRKYDQ